MSRLRCSLIVTSALLVVPNDTLAQTGGAPAAPGCSFLGVSPGAAFSESPNDFVLGAAAGWRFSPRVGAEARINWYKRPAGEEAVSAGLTAQLHLPGGPVEPLLRAGIGLHLASFDRDLQMPTDFYRRRMVDDPGRRYWTFHDPAVILGGGVDIPWGQYFSFRPEVEALVGWHGSQSYVITTTSLQLTVHFEPHSARGSAKTGRR